MEVTAIEDTFMKVGGAYAPATRLAVGDRVIAEIVQASAQEVARLKPMQRKGPWPALAMVAGIALLFSLLGNLLFFSQLQEQESQYDQLVNEFETNRELLAHLTHPDSRDIALRSTSGDSTSQAQVKWNPSTGLYSLYQWNLDPLAQDKVYQLWVILDGALVSAGLLADLNAPPQVALLSRRPTAFAISIEPEGGSEQPPQEWIILYAATS